MGCTSKGKTSIFSNLGVNKIPDESLSGGNVLFWNNGKSLIVTSGSSCQMYSVTTGEHLKKLFSCKSRIVSCHFDPKFKKYLVALSEEGELVQYDLTSEVVKKVCKLTFNAGFVKKQKVPKFQKETEGKHEWDNEILNDVKKRKFIYGAPQIVENFPKWLYWASWCLNDETECHITVFMSSSGAQVEKVRLPKLPLKKCYKNFGVTQTQDKNVLFVGMGINSVEVIHYKQGGLRMLVSLIHLLGSQVEVTCLTLCPNEFSFATADSRGLILVWKNILDRHPIKSSHQWHTVDIHDLAFSEEGAHLYSGGDENVLVKWSFLSNQKNFLPRLSSPICHISVSEGLSLVALSLADNEIDIIDSNFQKVSVIRKYSLYTPSTTRTNYVLTSDPRSDYLVLNGRPGYLQFISHAGNFKFLYSLDVGRTNYMTGDKNLVNLDVTHAKFSKNGSWLVTAEARSDNFLKEYRLKFWQYDETKQCFTLNTSTELPHDENNIHALEISSDDLVATSGDDKQFKLWAPFETMDVNVTKTVWSVLSSGKYKMLPCGPVDFCGDATLIAVGFGPCLTLWNTNSCTLKCSLVAPFKRDNIKFIKFGKEEHSHLIVTATDFNITTWNIITLTVSWTVDLSVSYLVGDFFNTYMCVFSKKGTLFVFSPGFTSPEFVLEGVSGSEVVGAHSIFYVKNENSPFQLYFINSERELFYLKSKEEPKEEEMPELMETHKTPFSAQIAQKAGGGVRKSVSEYIPTKSKKDSHYISSILDAPAHALPNPQRFCSDFLKSLTVAVPKSTEASDYKVKEPTESDDIEIIDDGDKDKISNDVSEDLLWLTVNDLFK